MPTRDQILEALKVVIDPELHKDIVTLGMVRSIDIAETGAVNVTVSLTTPGCPIKGHFQTGVANAVKALEGVTAVNVGFDVLSDTEKQGLQQKLGRASGLPAGALAQVANVVCIGSGKGGVGKSTLTVNLAAALQAEGKKVGVLDADVWGYSIPRMLGLGGQRPSVSPTARSSRSSRTASRSSRSASSSRRTRRSSGAARCCTRRSPSSSTTSPGASSTTC